MDNVFKDNPNLKAYYKTSDGTAFYTEADAKNYAKSLENKEVKLVERGYSKPEATTEKLDYKQAIKVIQESETLEQLEQFKDYPQPSVIKALAEKRAELTANIDVDAEDVDPNKE